MQRLRQQLAEGAPAEWRLPANGHTPLLAAAYNDSAECVRLLLAAGADVSVRGKDSWTALEHAEARGHAAVAALLRG